MIARSSRADVRNPAASDPDIAAAFAALPADSAQALRLALVAFTALFRAKGAKALKARKYFMHSYWMCLAVYARHLTLAIPKAAAQRPLQASRVLPAPGAVDQVDKTHDYPACAIFRGGRCTCD